MCMRRARPGRHGRRPGIDIPVVPALAPPRLKLLQRLRIGHRLRPPPLPETEDRIEDEDYDDRGNPEPNAAHNRLPANSPEVYGNTLNGPIRKRSGGSLSRQPPHFAEEIAENAAALRGA